MGDAPYYSGLLQRALRCTVPLQGTPGYGRHSRTLVGFLFLAFCGPGFRPTLQATAPPGRAFQGLQHSAMCAVTALLQACKPADDALCDGRCRVRGRHSGWCAGIQVVARSSSGRCPVRGQNPVLFGLCGRLGVQYGRESIFKFSHTKKFCGIRPPPNELRVACEPLTHARRVYKWEEKK